jgi:hypothetical protein
MTKSSQCSLPFRSYKIFYSFLVYLIIKLSLLSSVIEPMKSVNYGLPYSITFGVVLTINSDYFPKQH